MSEQPTHPSKESVPNPADQHGGAEGIPPGATKDKPTGFPTNDRHETEVTAAKDAGKPG